MSWCPTVRIVASNEDGYCVINEADFDAAKHTLWTDPLDHDGDGKPGGDASATDGLTKAEIIADLEAMGVEFDPRDRKADLLAQRDAARAAVDAAQ